MKKVLTITWNTDTGSMFTDWGDGVTATDVLAMCEFAEREKPNLRSNNKIKR